MKIKIAAVLLLTLGILEAKAQRSTPDQVKTKNGTLTIQPIEHATLVLTANNKTIYVDPTGGANAFQGIAAPDLILITDIHGDHMDPATLDAINKTNAPIVAPQAVADKLPAANKENLVIVKNGDKTEQLGISITAIPMYNLPKSADAFHTKGRGNGYVLNIGGKNVYISGDTEDTPEMRELKNIDIAFVCMNLPYTMTVKQAAEGVVAFKPKVVYPYHYRGTEGLSDVNEFKRLVNTADKKIEVRLKNWYPGK
jgi:L-ascorbate metabolism protein UlaG (beta-lactamase superfamily)